MQIDITGHHMEVTPAMRARVEKTLARALKRGEAVVQRAHVVLSVTRHRHACDVRLEVDGDSHVAKSESQDMYAAIDATMTKIARQLGAAKGRHNGTKRASK